MVDVQFEEGVGDLQHQDMRMVVLVAYQDPLACPPHTMLGVVFFKSLEPRKHGCVFLWLILLGAECVVTERVKADRLWLIGIEGLGEDGTIESISASEPWTRFGYPHGYEVCSAVFVTVDMLAVQTEFYVKLQMYHCGPSSKDDVEEKNSSHYQGSMLAPQLKRKQGVNQAEAPFVSSKY